MEIFLDKYVYLLRTQCTKQQFFIIQLYFNNELSCLEVVKTSLPENATTIFDVRTDVKWKVLLFHCLQWQKAIAPVLFPI